MFGVQSSPAYGLAVAPVLMVFVAIPGIILIPLSSVAFTVLAIFAIPAAIAVHAVLVLSMHLAVPCSAAKASLVDRCRSSLLRRPPAPNVLH